METKDIPNEPFLISEFRNVRSKTPEDIPFDVFMARIRSDRYKEHVTAYRRLAAQAGHEAGAQALKGRTPCVVMAGT